MGLQHTFLKIKEFAFTSIKDLIKFCVLPCEKDEAKETFYPVFKDNSVPFDTLVPGWFHHPLFRYENFETKDVQMLYVPLSFPIPL